MRGVIQRTTDPDGGLAHIDNPSTYEAAEAIAGRSLDRRRNYAIIHDEVCALASWSEKCSGCATEYDADRGSGCDECGYTGRRRTSTWLPLDAWEVST
jgi:hypothetical protein